MKKQLVIIGIVTVFASVGLCGCNDINTPSIISFSIEPYSIIEGQTAEISWNVKNATSVYIDNDVGVVSLTGVRTVTPRFTTVYTLTAKNEGKETIATCRIIVTPSDEYRFVETWNSDRLFEGDSGTIKFFSNNTVNVKFEMGATDYSFNGVWNINAGEITIQFPDYPGGSGDFNYQFSQNYKVLKLERGPETFVLTKS